MQQIDQGRVRQQPVDRIKQKLEIELGDIVLRYLNDPEVVEIVLNDDGVLWIERLGRGMENVGSMPANRAFSILATIASSLDKAITPNTPLLAGELILDGSRVQGAIPPVVAAPIFSIRKRASRVIALDEYVRAGTMSAAQRDLIIQGIHDKHNIVIVGGTGSGKTTLANGVISTINSESPSDRLVIIEDLQEIQSNQPNQTFLRSSDTVSLQDLLRVTLRLRPDRIIVGEVRGGEAKDLLKAWNTGHPGGISTIHANGSRDGLMRLEQMCEESGLPERTARKIIAAAVDMLVFIQRDPSSASGRRVTDIIAVDGIDGDAYITRSLTHSQADTAA